MDEILQGSPLLKIAPENGKCTEKELLTHWFDTNHGAFTIGTHVIHLVVFVGGGALVWICDCGDAGDCKTQRHSVPFGVQAHGWNHPKQSPALHLGLGWFNALRHGHPHSGNDEPQWNRDVPPRVCGGPIFRWRSMANISNQYSPQQLGPGVGS